jgi:hypothetical protein
MAYWVDSGEQPSSSGRSGGLIVFVVAAVVASILLLQGPLASRDWTGSDTGVCQGRAFLAPVFFTLALH